MKLELVRVERIRTGNDTVMAFSVPPSRRFDYRELVRKAQPSDRFDLVVSTPRKKRSTGFKSQNAHFNGHCQQISMETGQDFETVKLYVKRQAIPMGLPLKQRPDGEILYSIADGLPVPISETDMDTIQCGWCIDAAHLLAAELGIILREE